MINRDLDYIFIHLFLLSITYICMRVAYYIYCIVDKNAKIIESLNISCIATKGHIGKIVSCSLMLISLELILTLISYYLIIGVNNVYILPVIRTIVTTLPVDKKIPRKTRYFLWFCCYLLNYTISNVVPPPSILRKKISKSSDL